MAGYDSQFYLIEREQTSLYIRLLKKRDTLVDFLLKGIDIEIKGHRTGTYPGHSACRMWYNHSSIYFPLCHPFREPSWLSFCSL